MDLNFGMLSLLFKCHKVKMFVFSISYHMQRKIIVLLEVVCCNLELDAKCLILA